MTDRNYRPDIDGLRAIAVVAVVLFHAFPARLPGGFIGVDIFFVISGFLISRIIFAELAAGKFSFVQFYARRARRLFPALILVLTFCAVVGWIVLLADEYAQLGKHIASSVGFIQNLVLLNESGYFDTAAEQKPLLHLWSLGIEEQFYIVWPIVLCVLWSRQCSIRWVLWFGAGGSLLLGIWLTHTNPAAAFFLPISRFWELLAGAALAWSTNQTDGRSSDSTKCYGHYLSVLGSVLIVTALMLISKQREFPGVWALLPVLGTALLLYAGPDAIVNRVLLANKALVWIGLISYPLYLWHWPLLAFVHILENQWPNGLLRLLLVFCAFGLAALTYFLVERPLRFRHQSGKLVVLGLWASMLSLGVLGLWIYGAGGLPNREVAVASQATAKLERIDPLPARSCLALGEGQYQVPPEVMAHCKLYSNGSPVKRIVFWGDSSVLSWLPVFSTIANEKSYELVALSHQSCPPILGARKTSFTFDESRRYCADGSIQKKIVSFIEHLKPDVIVVAASWSYYLNREYVTLDTRSPADAESARRVLELALPETLNRLSQIAPLVVVRDWPRMPVRPNLRTIDLLGYERRPVNVPRDLFNQTNAIVNQVFNRVSSDRIDYFDPAEKVCDQRYCYSVRDGLLYYEDEYHMSSQGAMQYKAEIESLLSKR